jgi:hypothetical protein
MTPMVSDIHVEEYHVLHVNLYQDSPLPVVHTMDASVHR